jgi:hypothetical protein
MGKRMSRRRNRILDVTRAADLDPKTSMKSTPAVATCDVALGQGLLPQCERPGRRFTAPRFDIALLVYRPAFAAVCSVLRCSFERLR